jgi:hypothetical protein
MYSSLLGVDPWSHQLLANIIIEKGHIPIESDLDIFPSIKHSLIGYSTMPGFHLFVGIQGIVYALSYIKISIITGVFSSISVIIFSYLIGTKLVSSKIGLLSSFFVSFSDNVINMLGISVIANSIGVVIVLILTYVILFYQLPNYKFIIITLILAFYIVITHTLSFAFLIIIILVLLVNNIIKFGYYSKQAKSLLTKMVLFTTLGLFYWSWISKMYFPAMVRTITKTLMIGVDEERYLSTISVPLLEVLLARIGMLLFFLFASILIVYIIYTIRYRNDVNNIIPISSIFIIFTIIGILGALIPSFSGIAHRFWFFAQIVSAPLIAYILAIYIKNTPIKTIKKISIVLFIILLISTNTLSNIANNDRPIAPTYSERTGLYDSEINTVIYLSTLNNTSFLTDRYYASRIIYIINDTNDIGLVRSLNTYDAGESSLFIIRQKAFNENRLIFLDNNGHYTNSGIENHTSAFQYSEFDEIQYSCGTVIIINYSYS